MKKKLTLLTLLMLTGCDDANEIIDWKKKYDEMRKENKQLKEQIDRYKNVSKKMYERSNEDKE